MAENDKTEELISYLKSIGFEGKHLEEEIRAQYKELRQTFTVTHQLNVGNEIMLCELRFMYDRQFSAYKLQSYDALYHQPVIIDHKNINGINTEALEKSMAEIDWEHYFHCEMNDIEFEQDLSPLFKSLWKLSDNDDEEGENIQSKLIYKYWPSDNWKYEADNLQFVYKKNRTFQAGEAGIINANLAYNILSERYNDLYTSIAQSGLEQYPGLDLKNLLATYLSGTADRFDIAVSTDVPEGIIDFCIPVRKIGAAYTADVNQVTFTPYPEIQHSVVGGIDTAELEEQIKKINWEKDKLFIFDKNEDVHLLPHISEIREKVFHISRYNEGKDIADYLQIKYWSDSFMHTYIAGPTLEQWDNSLKVRQHFSLKDNTRTISNLMQGRPVHASLLKTVGCVPDGWLIIDPTCTGVEGHQLNPIEFVPGLSRTEVEMMVNMLPLDGTMYVRDIIHSIAQGDRLLLNLLDAATTKQVVISANPAEKKLDVLTPEGCPIPFNFWLDTNWGPAPKQTQDIARKQEEPKQKHNHPKPVKPRKNTPKKGRGI